MATLGYEDICGLDVTVNDALGVSGVEGVSNLDGQRQQCVQFQRSDPDQMLQRLPIEILHGNERLAILLANVINSADVGVIQGGRSLRLTSKPLEGLRVAGHVFGQELQGDEAIKTGVLGLVHHPHTTAAQLLYNPIVRDGFADHRQGATVARPILGGQQEQVNAPDSWH